MSFEAVIKDREKHDEKTETRFVSIDKAELVSAEARDRAAQLTVRFVSQMISVTRDKTGAIVDGNPDKVADITDVWTFARDTSSRDPNWKVGTERGLAATSLARLAFGIVFGVFAGAGGGCPCGTSCASQSLRLRRPSVTCHIRSLNSVSD